MEEDFGGGQGLNWAVEPREEEGEEEEYPRKATPSRCDDINVIFITSIK
jgi:hypothetical protein